MVAPIRWLGPEPRFYRVRPDLSLDLEDLSRRMTARTRCVIAVHYFGFLQDLAPLRRLCDERNIVLIEDCAHALFGEVLGAPVGSVGDYAFGSVMKFFPVYDGGCLVSARGLGVIEARRGGTSYQLKALVNTLERSHMYGRLPPRGFWSLAFRGKKRLLTAAKSGRGAGAIVAAPGSLDGGYEFESAWMNVEMSWPSAALLRLVSSGRCVDSRRANYTRLLASLEGLAGGRPLYRELPPTVVPYVFPFFVEDPATVFPSLKERGVPLLRWEDANTTECAVSASYSQQLLLIPCHQELDADDVSWIGTQVREALIAAGRTS
jgi:dTDP-4-amino-4,6-dideoxygalactose transaminase